MRGLKKKIIAIALSASMLAASFMPYSVKAGSTPFETGSQINENGFLKNDIEDMEVGVTSMPEDPLKEIHVYENGVDLDLGLEDLDRKTYYVDASHGSDENDGLSEETAWKSLEKVNSTKYKPCTQILFQRGEAWNGNLIVSSSGEEGKQIIYGAYGEGEKPLINGTGDTEDLQVKTCASAVLIKDQEYVTIQDLSITNLGKKPDGTPNDVEELGVNEGLRSGIVIAATRGISTRLRGIQITGNEIYNVKGSTDRYPAQGSYGMYHNAGIFVWIEGTKGETAQFDGLKVENNFLHDMSCQGMNFNVEDAGYYNFRHDRYNQGVEVKNNMIARTGADAIVIEYCNEVLVERNVGYDAGQKTKNGRPSVIAGIWQSNVNNPVFQYNECARTRFFAGDGMAWDIDWGTGGTSLYQYNYSHENEGGMLMDCAFSSPNYKKWIMRYNLSVDEPGQQWTIVNHYVGNMEFYNNTVYIAPGGGRLLIQEKSDLKDFFNNNIFVADQIMWSNSKSEFNNNLIWGHGNDVELPSKGVNTFVGDPKFEDPSVAEVASVVNNKVVTLKTPGALDGYDKTGCFKLREDSPAINRGIEINENGGKDLFGNKLYYGAPDIGMHEFQGEPSGVVPPEKLPMNGASGIEAELYEDASSSELRIQADETANMGKALTGFQDGDTLTYPKVKFEKPVQTIKLALKTAQDVRVKVLINGEEQGECTVKASNGYGIQVFNFEHEVSEGIKEVKLQLLGEGVSTARFDRFYIIPLPPKSFEVPFIHTFNEDVESWKSTNETGKVEVKDGKLVLTETANGTTFISERAPMVQDGIVEFQLTTGTNAKATGIVRYDLDTGKYIEIGMDSVGDKYWFIDGTYDNISHIQFNPANCPKVEANKTYAIKIKMVGEQITVWVDGVELFDRTFTGLELKAGVIGAKKWNSNQVSLDNIKINSGTIKGQVTGSNGVGIGNVEMKLNETLDSAVTDAKGYYEFKVPIEWDKEYTVTGHEATQNLEEKKAITSMDHDTVTVDYVLAMQGTDKEALNSLIVQAKQCREEEYTTESWSVLVLALSVAEGVVGDANAVQEAIDRAAADLDAALKGLKAKLIELPHTFTFETGLEGWRGVTEKSKISIDNQKMLLKDTDRNGTWISAQIPDLADGTIEYEFTPIAPNGFIGGKAAITFRVDEVTGSSVQFGADSLGSDYWFVSGSGIGENHVLNGGPKLTAGETYKIKIKFLGENLKIWINDVCLLDKDFSGMRTEGGKIGVHSWDTTEVLFDNITVTSDTEPVKLNLQNARYEDSDTQNQNLSVQKVSLSQVRGTITDKKTPGTEELKLHFPKDKVAEYKIIATMSSGTEYTLQFGVDRKPPKLQEIENGGVYSAPIILNVEEDHLLSATVNGTPFQNGTILKAAGTYQVEIEDKAGNQASYEFEVKRDGDISDEMLEKLEKLLSDSKEAKAAAEAAQKKAEEEKMAAEAAKKAAEEAKAAAEAAQNAANEDAAAAKEAKEKADAAYEAAKAAQLKAEEAQKAAQESQQASQSAQEKAEAAKAEIAQMKQDAEEAKQKAEEAQKQAEAERQAAEEAQKKAEAERQAAEEAQKKAEAERQAAEEAQKKAEEQRQAAEAAQKKAEEQRQAAEEAQKKAEAERQAAQEAQKKAEEARIAAEQAQKKAEEILKAAEDKNNQTNESLKKGQVYQVGGYKYKITAVDSDSKTVSVIGATNKGLKTITIPSSVTIQKVKFKVTDIGSKAFQNYKKLTSVTIGSSVKTIGSYAFAGDSKLTKVTVKSTGLKTIGKNALKGISSKAVIRVPKSKLKAYNKLWKGKGQSKSVKITK